MKPTLKNRIKLWWHCFTQSFAGPEHLELKADGEIFCFCGFEDNRPKIQGIDKEYRRIVERASQYSEDFDIPN